MTFTKIIEMCEKHGFLHKIKKYNLDILKIGATGALLQENLRNEWLYSMITNRDLTVCLNSHAFSETFAHIKQLCSQKLPFAVAEIEEERARNVAEAYLEAKGSEEMAFKRCFIGEDRLVLNCSTFVAPAVSMPYFHQWQRYRKAWWRKFSASPGRYILTDIQTKNDDHSVEIKAEYSWGVQLLETINLHTGKHRELTPDQQLTKDGRKQVQAHFVTNTVCLSTMVLNTLCDAYEEPLFQDEKRPLFKFHRKLAPYKIAFAIYSNVSTLTEQLQQLAQYLGKQLRAKKISTLFLPSAHRDTLEVQWNKYDQMGVPYHVLLNEKTLRNGILHLRSRDTTLKEQVHVSELQSYVVKLFENY